MRRRSFIGTLLALPALSLVTGEAAAKSVPWLEMQIPDFKNIPDGWTLNINEQHRCLMKLNAPVVKSSQFSWYIVMVPHMWPLDQLEIWKSHGGWERMLTKYERRKELWDLKLPCRKCSSLTYHGTTFRLLENHSGEFLHSWAGYSEERFQRELVKYGYA